MYCLCGTVLTTLIYVLTLFEKTEQNAKIANYFLKALPPYLFGASVIDISRFGSEYENTGPSYGSLYSIGRNGQNIIYFMGTGLVYFLLTLLIDRLRRTNNKLG